VGISSSFLPNDLSLKLKGNLNNLLAANKLFSAGMGQNTDFHRDQEYRKDKISWLERDSENESEIDFFKYIDTFVHYLNRSCFAGITSYEFHYAIYENGSYYKRHFDRFLNNDSRVFSMIMYLNEDWKEGDGGELIVYPSRSMVKIKPKMGKMVFFDSSHIEHEVLETYVPRRSITGWLKR